MVKKSAGRPAKDGVRRSFLIERELSEALDEFCEKTARSKTKVVEAAIKEYMEKHADV